jgi:RHS repeat-associated protein
MEADEFGVPRTSAGYRYGWLGGKQRRTELATGAIAMGERLYVPQLGRFAQVDPVPGGSANEYDYANQDPANTFDLDGRMIPNDSGNHPLYVNRCYGGNGSYPGCAVGKKPPRDRSGRVVSRAIVGCVGAMANGPPVPGAPALVRIGKRIVKVFPTGRAGSCLIGAVVGVLLH